MRVNKQYLLFYAITNSNLGRTLIAKTDKGLSALFFGEDDYQLKNELQKRFPSATLTLKLASEEWVKETIDYIEAPQKIFHLPMDIKGTAFQIKVWQALQQVPFGETLSYSAIAEQIGAKKAVRAVANACAANKLAILIPCHRAISRHGGLSGYRWGVRRKRQLLEREATIKLS